MNYRKYVELNKLLYEGNVVGYRVSFYVVRSSGFSSRILFKKCDTSEKSVIESININREGNNIILRLVGNSLVSPDENDVVEVNTVKEMKSWEKRFDKFYTSRVEFGEKTKEVGTRFLNLLRTTLGYDDGRVDCEEVSVRYLGGYREWVSNEEDDDFPEAKKSLFTKLDSVVRNFNKDLKNFKVEFVTFSEKAWMYFKIAQR